MWEWPHCSHLSTPANCSDRRTDISPRREAITKPANANQIMAADINMTSITGLEEEDDDDDMPLLRMTSSRSTVSRRREDSCNHPLLHPPSSRMRQCSVALILRESVCNHHEPCPMLHAAPAPPPQGNAQATSIEGARGSSAAPLAPHADPTQAVAPHADAPHAAAGPPPAEGGPIDGESAEVLPSPFAAADLPAGGCTDALDQQPVTAAAAAPAVAGVEAAAMLQR